jgi:serine phosphatase RsbU (regulator of sigma subunit)
MVPETTILDPARLDAVARSGLVDSRREAVFDELTALAAELLDAPFAFVTVVDDRRSFWKSAHGILDGTRSSSVSDSFCQYVIELGDEFVVGDAERHPTTAGNPSIDSMDVKAWAGCPVVFDGTTLGTFCVVDQRTRDWTDRDRQILRTLASSVNREVAHRADPSRVMVDETQLELLRQSLMPHEFPPLEGIRIAGWHRPASDSVLLGDFYDAIDLGGGRSLVAIGDVCGHGPVAAEITIVVRDALHRAAERSDDPATILGDCNIELLRSAPDQGRFATASVIVLTPGDDGVEVHTSSAGHPAVIVIGPDAAVGRLPAPDGPPLGVTDDVTFGGHTHHLPYGHTLIAFTDGATECRNATDDLLGAEALAAMVGALPVHDSPQELVDALSASILDYASELTDDIALLAIRLGD